MSYILSACHQVGLATRSKADELFLASSTNHDHSKSQATMPRISCHPIPCAWNILSFGLLLGQYPLLQFIFHNQALVDKIPFSLQTISHLL